MNDFFMDTYKRTGLVFARGEGARLLTTDGRSFIDFAAGIAVNCLGHGHPRLVAAVAEQAARLMHVSNYYQTETSLALAKELCAATGMDAVFFCNSGTEANEGGIKIARKFGAAKDPARTTVVTLVNSFHGRTIAALRATGQEKLHKDFGPFPPGFVHVKPDDLAALDAALDNNACALLLEPVQGEGGVYPLDPAYVRKAAALCKERGILLVADEVQCGIGRTGAILESRALGIDPDLVLVAKGLGGGLPIGAILAKGEAAKVLVRGDHGSTFGGNPVAAAAARVVLSELASPGFLEAIADKGRRIMAAISGWKHPLVSEVRGRGLMIGAVTTVKPDLVKEACMERGLLVLTAGEDVLRLLPPFVIKEADIAEGLAILRAALDSVQEAGRG